MVLVLVQIGLRKVVCRRLVGEDRHRVVTRFRVVLFLLSWTQRGFVLIKSGQTWLTECFHLFESFLGRPHVPLTIVRHAYLARKVIRHWSHILGELQSTVSRLFGVDVFVKVYRHYLFALRVAPWLGTVLLSPW